MLKRSLLVSTLLVLAPALSLSNGLRAAPVTVPGFSYVKSLGGIDEYRFRRLDEPVALHLFDRPAYGRLADTELLADRCL